MKDLYAYAESFREPVENGEHPVQVMLDELAANDESQRLLHCQQLQNWYSEYTTIRGIPSIFKPPGQET